MLYERSLFEECFEILSDTIEQATYYENNEVLTIALKLELEYLLRLNSRIWLNLNSIINTLCKMKL